MASPAPHQRVLHRAEPFGDHLGVGKRGDDAPQAVVELRTYRRIVEMAWRQPAQHAVVRQAQCVERAAQQRLHRGCMDADRQVDARLGIGLRRMHPAARDIEHVARIEPQRERFGQALCAERLAARQRARRHIGVFIDEPGLRSLDLQDQHVMVVIMRQEGLRPGWRDIGVDLGLEVELDLDGMRQRGDRGQIAVEAVEHDRIACGKFVADAHQVERAVAHPIGIGVAIAVAPHQPHHRGRRAHDIEELLDLGGPEQLLEMARRPALKMVVRPAPHLVEEGLHPDRLEQPRQRRLGHHACPNLAATSSRG